MSFFGVGNPFSTVVGQKIEQATDSSLASENWALNMEICDMINTSAEASKDAVKAIRKRIVQNAGKNYTIVMYTLTVLETCVKNCGRSFHAQVMNKDFIGELIKLIQPKNDPPTAVQDKVLSLIQSWADAFQNQPELNGVTQWYNELKSKGIEFPMTDLDAMAPIFTPQRSVGDTGDGVAVGSPQRAVVAPTMPDSPHLQAQVAGTVTLSPSQCTKLRADLSVVEGNMAVMSDMLSELTGQPPERHLQSDIDLLNELADTLRAMQTRVAELVARLSGDAPLTEELLIANDHLNSLLLRHQRFNNNRNAAASGTTPSAILGAAMGVPGTVNQAAKTNEPSLIDLSDDVPDIAKLNLKSAPKSPGSSSKDEFDMFAQSRNNTYDNTKTTGSSYADSTEAHAPGLASAVSQRATQAVPPSGIDEREIDEIAAWLAQEKAASSSEASLGVQESVTSSDFDKFLAERAAAAENLPNVNENREQNPPQASPRHRPTKKSDDDMLAL